MNDLRDIIKNISYALSLENYSVHESHDTVLRFKDISEGICVECSKDSTTKKYIIKDINNNIVEISRYYPEKTNEHICYDSTDIVEYITADF